jgi:hypothetical protein
MICASIALDMSTELDDAIRFWQSVNRTTKTPGIDTVVKWLMDNLWLHPFEVERIEKWEKQHAKNCRVVSGSVGDRFTYRISPTGLGNCIVAECPCGVKEDITDTDNW